ncbi:FkbM family methyltransferase [Algoriphagus pacificus]|uniref:FkbM family methyltransferase n=1 Tax=Algoriphagus pacificus TaxID=2811234 RepID=A0ABS3CLW2_9BACT|nr:FkbM family methyltransferase [Algoriphagus pacificus]MBN7817529.1 FkbM family methyltransferase [Algoriphagus pacificus]
MNFLKKKIRNLFYRIAKPISRRLELNLTGAVSNDEIKSLLKKLHPIDPKIELIRIGPNGDGGYLLPNDLKDIETCFSPGVDIESRFEFELAEMGIEVFMADYSIENPTIDHPKFEFSKKFIGADDMGNYMTMDTWVNQNLSDNKNSELLLQMDIEGYEYDVILALSRPLLDRFRIIVIELHHLDRIADRYFFNQLNRFFEKLLSNHSIVHLHPNNNGRPIFINGIEIPPLMEITLLRNDRFSSSDYFSKFPHPLDKPNVDKDDVVLPKFWFRVK